MRPASVCIWVAILALIVCGCGPTASEVSSVSKGIPVTDDLVTSQEIQRLPPGSPGRVLLRWWRAIQYQDLPEYLDLLSSQLRQQPGLENQVRNELPLAAGSVIPAQPELKSTEITGDAATLYTQIVTRHVVGTTRYIETRTPQPFRMVKERGGWRLRDDQFVEATADAYSRLVQRAEKR